MAWVKKFTEYARDIEQYTNLCTCPAHSEFQTAVIFNTVKKLKLNRDILGQISIDNPNVPGGLHFNNLNNEIKQKIFEDLTNELIELDNKFALSSKNTLILKYLMRVFKHYGDISKFETDILYTPISKLFQQHKGWILSG